MNKKMIVWDLFGGGQNSVYHALNDIKLLSKYDVYTFDVTKKTRQKHFKLDLSQNNIIAKFKKFPKPDIIVSSTLCQSFSCVLNMKGGGTCFWKFNNSKTRLVFRPISEFERLKSGFTKNLKADTQLFIAKLGKKCIDNTIDLIKFYKPKYWYIENPKHSLIWKYITLNRRDFFKENKCFMNEASYGKYGYLTTKATIFLSNLKMSFMTGKIDPPYFIKTDSDGIMWYVLKDDPTVKMRKNLDSRMIGMAHLKRIIKARKVKSGMGGMDFVMRQPNYQLQRNKMVNEQLSEAGPASAIPHTLIIEIFKYFK